MTILKCTIRVKPQNIKIKDWSHLKNSVSHTLREMEFPLSNFYVSRRLDLFKYPSILELYFCKACRKAENRVLDDLKFK